MSLPVQISNARYRVAGSYIYKGDLIVSWGIIYYVPLQYLKSRGMQDEGALFGGVVGGLLVGKMESYTPNVDESIKLFERPVMNWKLLWQSRPTDQHLQAVLDSYITELKNYPSASVDDLPVPGRYPKAEVRNLSLNALGRLSFETQFDEHVFKIGLLAKSKLQQALKESGFIS
jgi:hypothetical protein